MRRQPVPARRGGNRIVRSLRLAPLLGLVLPPVIYAAACSDPHLEKIQASLQPVNNELEIQGQVCTTPPADAIFPVKVLFLVDVSSSMIATDPEGVRVKAVQQVIQKYQGLPGVEFAVVTFSGAIFNVTNGFTNAPDMSAVGMALMKSDTVTDDQGALGSAYEVLSTDMINSTPAERARSKYIVILFTDGVPDPLCSAQVTQCGPMTCQPGTHCVPTTILDAQSNQQESYKCVADYPICSVPKKDWANVFKPPVDPTLYPGLQAGADYNTTAQLYTSVDQIMGLQKQYHVGSIQVNTNFLFPIAAVGSALAAPFNLDRPAGEELLKGIAAHGQGAFQEFTSNTDVNFLNINFAAVQVQNKIVATLASNQSTVETGADLEIDTDGDGLSDDEEKSLGTCDSLSPKCPTPNDSDKDGYSDFFEQANKASGFDPLDPKKPSTPCDPKKDADGDGLLDCEEAFLKTDPLNADTDGDRLTDWVEFKNGMNPLDPSDSYTDTNADGVLNFDEIQLGLNPAKPVSSAERVFAYEYTFEPTSTSDAGAGCYAFDVQHMRLVTTGKTARAPEGINRIYFDVNQNAVDSPATFATVRRACADVVYLRGVIKLPLSGVVYFTDDDFVDISSFNPDKNCKNFAAGFDFDAGLDGATGPGATGDGGGKDSGKLDAGGGG
jgi:hypothetical protein